MKKGGYVVENEGRSRKEGMAKEGVKEEACRRGIVDEGADGRVAGADAEGHLEVTALTIASLHLALSLPRSRRFVVLFISLDKASKCVRRKTLITLRLRVTTRQ